MANKKEIGIGVAVAAGAGAAAYAAKNHKKNEAGGNVSHAVLGKAVGKKDAYTELDYHNTELDRHDKNSKGIYYTDGNYEVSAESKKPTRLFHASRIFVNVVPRATKSLQAVS